MAARHCKVAAEHFRSAEVPRGAAHAWAAYGHLLEGRKDLHSQAREHSRRTIQPPADS